MIILYLSVLNQFHILGGTYKLSFKKAKAEAKPAEVTDDDILFWSYVAEEERPVTLYHIDHDDSDENEEEEEEKDSDDSDEM